MNQPPESAAAAVYPQPTDGLRVAVVASAWFHKSHADVIVSRWKTVRPGDAPWGWTGPRTRLVSAHIHQTQDDDIGVAFCRRHGIPLGFRVADALTTPDGKELAVDAVLLIGEHGRYMYNELGQKLYPRKELFDQIVAVFRKVGRCVPVFCDKFYSWRQDWAVEMEQTARELGFLLFGGSSVPHASRLPAALLPVDVPVKQAVGCFYGADEAYGYHSAEYMLSLLEQRAGGEGGVAAITVWRGPEVWRQLDAGVIDAALVEAAVAALPEAERIPGDMRQLSRDAIRADVPLAAAGPVTAFMVEHHDGLRCAYLNLNGKIKGFSGAWRQGEQIHATSAFMEGESTHYAHFAGFARYIEDVLLGDRPTVPARRVLLSTGITAAMMQARATPGVRVLTPQLALPYRR